jgi:transposase
MPRLSMPSPLGSVRARRAQRLRKFLKMTLAKIENFFCRIKDWRRIATRYDKLARNFLAAATLIGALYWIKL